MSRCDDDGLDRAMVRYAAGDPNAFPEIFAALAPRLRQMLRRLCGSEQLAQDLTQETFLRIHRARGSFASDQRVVPWVYTIARNCYASYARSPRARIARGCRELELHALCGGVESNAEEAAAARQTAAVVARALADMAVVHREAFALLRLEGHSVADAAELLGATESAIKLRAFRASESLRASLGARGLRTTQRVSRRAA